MLDIHLHRLLGELIWKLTEAEGKRNTQYWSRAAVSCTEERQLCHEHVITKQDLIDQLLRAEPWEAEKILGQAVACTVTLDEHKQLSKCDKRAKGWNRYDLAKVDVINRRTGEPRSIHH